MSDKIQLHRRGFLANILKGTAAVAATATVIEVTEDKAGASTVKNVTDEYSLFENGPSFDDLMRKVKKDPKSFTKQDCFYLAAHMNACDDAAKVMIAYAELQKGLKVLVQIHPFVVDKILHIVSVFDARREDRKIYCRLKNIPLMDGNDRDRFGIPTWED